MCSEVERVQRRLESVQSKGEAPVVVCVLLSGSPGLTSQRLRVHTPHVMVH
jgi:hypothetical protein